MDEYFVERPEEDDYDLLTFGEADARLREALARDTHKLAALPADAGSDSARTRLTARIAALHEAIARNSRPAAGTARPL